MKNIFESKSVKAFELDLKTGAKIKQLDPDEAQRKLRELVKGLRVVANFHSDKFEIEASRFGMSLRLIVPISMTKKTDREVFMSLLSMTGAVFSFPYYEKHASPQITPKWKKFVGTNLDLTFLDTGLSVEISGNRYEQGEIDWYKIERIPRLQTALSILVLTIKTLCLKADDLIDSLASEHMEK